MPSLLREQPADLSDCVQAKQEGAINATAVALFDSQELSRLEPGTRQRRCVDCGQLLLRPLQQPRPVRAHRLELLDGHEVVLVLQRVQLAQSGRRSLYFVIADGGGEGHVTVSSSGSAYASIHHHTRGVVYCIEATALGCNVLLEYPAEFFSRHES